MPRVDRLITLLGFNTWYKLSSARNAAIPILMYHSISDERETGHPYFWINTCRKQFAEHMQFLKEKSYTVISLDDAVEILEAGKESENPHPRYVVLTFDDGYHDFLINAWPELASREFTATVFVSTAFVGDGRKMFNGRECLTWSELRDLSGLGVSFGSHTVNHPKLYELPWGRVREELLESRLRLEDMLQTSVSSFAYPYAFPQEDSSFVRRFRQELIDQGYRIAVNTAIGMAKYGDDSLSLKRLPVNNDDDLPFLSAKLAGAYDWISNAQYLARWIRSKMTPNSNKLESSLS